MQSASPAGFVGAYRKETKHFCSLLNAMDGLLWYLNLVATGLLLIPISCIIVMWEVSDVHIDPGQC